MARELQVDLFIQDLHAARVSRFTARHEAGRPFEIDAEVVLSEYVELDALVGQSATLLFGAVGEEPRAIRGIIEAARVLGSTELSADARGALYVLRVVSPLGLLGRSVDSRIFQEKSVKDIVAEVLSDHGIEDVAWRLSGDYPPREYCVQYQESALAFVSRLLEQEGIYSFVDPKTGGLVFADDSTAAPPIDGDPVLPSQPRSALLEDRDAIYSIRERARVRSGKVVLRDFDFERPKLDLTATAAARERTDLELYDYPGGYFEPSDGGRFAKVRLEAEQVERSTLEIEAVCPRLAPGMQISILDAGDLDGDYFIFSAAHEYVHQPAGDRGSRYMARARLVPLSVPFRAAQVTPAPVLEGPQTAIVVVPEGAPPESIHTDKHGRCKVKFHWDRRGKRDDKASCWMRVAQMQTSGSMILPRIGWEVVVEFLEGNPDRPIITGRLYNGVYMPPYALPEGKTRTALRTASTPGGGGVNEIRFEDKAGAEEIMLQAQRDMSIAVANNAKKTVGNNETTVVGNNASLKVGANQTTKITKGSSNTIGADQSVSVGGNRSVEVNAVAALTAHGSATTSVGGNQFEMDGNPLEALLALAAQKAAELATAMADNAIAAVQGQVDGAINQVMGPINALNQQVQGLASAMEAAKNGDLSAVGSMVARASGLPGASDLAASFGGGGAPGGGASGGSAAAGGLSVPGLPGGSTNALAAIASNAAHRAISKGTAAAHGALANALGIDASGGGGESMANAGGPAGDVAGVDATDREKGPGHSMAKVAGSHSETVGGLQVLGALQTIDTNVAADKTVNVGAATVELAIGDYAETVSGSKTESALGLVVLSKGGESETAGGSKTVMVGGAIVDKLQGSHTIEAGGPATFIGAFHKVEAGGSIVFKCGASEVVIDGGGVTITSPIVAFLAPRIQLPKKVSEV
jgi:type VI secretion system secreted protein VgrG